MTTASNSYARIEWNTQMSQYKPISIETLTEKQLDRELEKGYADMLEGRVQSAEMVFAEMNEEYVFAE